MAETEGSSLTRESSINHCMQSYGTVSVPSFRAVQSRSLWKYLIFVHVICTPIGLQVILDHWCDEVYDFLHGAAPSHDQSAHQSTHMASASHVRWSTKTKIQTGGSMSV